MSSTAAGFYVVWRTRLNPATRRRQTFEQAMADAKVLAQAHPGEDICVLYAETVVRGDLVIKVTGRTSETKGGAA